MTIPGIATPTEAFTAIGLGADALKLFPAESAPPEVLKAFKAVLPKPFPVLPVGGITPEKIGPYIQAGASGFGLGSALYKPGSSAKEVHENAEKFNALWQYGTMSGVFFRALPFVAFPGYSQNGA